jgi:hypothetical protein
MTEEEMHKAELAQCETDPLRKMMVFPNENDFSVYMMQQCVRILEHYFGKSILYKNRMVSQVLAQLQNNEIRNRSARVWALCYFMCHFEPVFQFVESITEDKPRLYAFMEMLPAWMEWQKNFPYTINNVRNLVADFLLNQMIPLYIFGPQQPQQQQQPPHGKRLKK